MSKSDQSKDNKKSENTSQSSPRPGKPDIRPSKQAPRPGRPDVRE